MLILEQLLFTEGNNNCISRQKHPASTYLIDFIDNVLYLLSAEFL
jgi:hypothetical protein